MMAVKVVGGKLAKAGRNWTRVQEECDVGGGGGRGNAMLAYVRLPSKQFPVHNLQSTVRLRQLILRVYIICRTYNLYSCIQIHVYFKAYDTSLSETVLIRQYTAYQEPSVTVHNLMYSYSLHTVHFILHTNPTT